MCQVQITKYSGCGCEIYYVLARCAMSDGAGNCIGQTRYERVVQEGVCQGHSGAYYPYSQQHCRWAGASAGGKDTLISGGITSAKPTNPAAVGEATVGGQRYGSRTVKPGRGNPATSR